MKYSPRPYERLLTRFITRQTGVIDALIDQFVNDATMQSLRFNPSPSEDFFFRNFPALSRAVDSLLHGLSQRLTRTIQAGSEWAWELANAKNDNMVEKIVKSIGAERIPAGAVLCCL